MAKKNYCPMCGNKMKRNKCHVCGFNYAHGSSVEIDEYQNKL